MAYKASTGFYRVGFWNGATATVPATDVQEALDNARQDAVDKFIEEWNRSVLTVAPLASLPVEGSVFRAVEGTN